MKKRIVAMVSVLSLLICVTPTAFAAKVGSDTGYYYYTDIKTYLFGARVNTINIGGETLIDAESMAHYGFTVTWHASARWLEIQDNGVHVLDDDAKSGALLDMTSGKTGKVAGKYYYTDIETSIASVQGTWVIQCYNIGGRTFISAEQLRGLGFDVYWNQEARTLTIQPAYSESGRSSAWVIPISEGADSDGTYTPNYFWLTAEKDINTGLINSVGGYGLPSLSAVTLSRDLDGRIVLSFCLYDGSTQHLSDTLSEKLEGVYSMRYTTYFREPDTVSAELNTLMAVYLNGVRVDLKELDYFRSTTHTIYDLVLDQNASLEPINVYSLALLCNVPSDAGLMLPPDTSGMTPYEVALSRLEQNYLNIGGNILWQAETEKCAVVYGSMTTPHGTTYVLQLVHKNDGSTVSLLTQTGLSNIWGVHPPLYDFSVSSDESALYFSCDKDGITYHFKGNLPSGDIQKISR